MASETDTVVDDTLLEQQAVDAKVQTETPANADTVPEGQELFAGKYKSAKDLEAGYKQLRAEATKAEQDRADLRRKLELAEMKKSLVDSIRDGLTPTRDPNAEAEALKRERDAYVALMTEKGEAGVLEFVENFERTRYQKTKSEISEELKRRDERIAQLEAGLTEMKETSDPVYQQNRELVTSMMQEDGLSRSQALKVLRKIKPPTAAAMESGGGISARRGVASDLPKQVMSDSDIEAKIRELQQIMGPEGLSPEEIEEERKALKGVRK